MKRTAFIAIVGRPNVGKSTLLNAMLGEKIAIVSKKPQTTRNRITGILTRGEDQFVFLDTPGIHRPQTKLGDFMVKTATGTMGDSDAVILIVEAGKPMSQVEENVIEQIKNKSLPAILVINKTDLSSPEKIAETIKTYSDAYDFNAFVPISAKKQDGVSIVLDEASKLLSESDWFFPEDMITDQPERQFASEVIREKLLRTLDKEIPHGTAVVIEGFEDLGRMIKIRAEIYCEKESHKGIIVGKNGAALKLVGTYAREDLEKFFGVKVYLNLWVKVKANWRDNEITISNFGYNND
ncbi:MAG: GTPase Era [Clostridia bacterium]|nr:GTPase Era [Clostridia bacterium]